jgi:hypothetical protein
MIEQYLNGPFFEGFFCGCFFSMATLAVIHLTLSKTQENEQ